MAEPIAAPTMAASVTGSGTWTSAVPGPLLRAAVWRVDLVLDDTKRAACIAALSDEERTRAARFLRREDHDRYAGSHAALRRILGRVLGADPASLRFRTNAAGKPELDGPWRGGPAFNLSHSGSVGLIGLSPAGRIGVDVEAMRPIADCLRLARSYFAPDEISALSRLPPATLPCAFYACWTRKEAFVKALGRGLSFPLDRFSVAIPPAPAALLAVDGSRHAAAAWRLQHLEPAPDHIGAVATETVGGFAALCSLEPGWATART